METNSNSLKEINRRRFLKIAAALTAMAYVPVFGQSAKTDKWGSLLPTRKLGKTGLDVTMFTLGGGPYNINTQDEEAILETAFKGGCRFFETAKAYGTEPAFGKLLEPYRKEIILSTKSGAFDAETLNRDLDASLKALRTDYLDIYLMHNVSTMDSLKRKIDGGVYDAMLKAKQEGKVRHIGFSGHSDCKVNSYLIDMKLPDLEVMLVPVNVIDPVKDSFIINTLPTAIENNIGIMAMKPLGGGAMIGADITWGQGKGTKRPRVIPEIIGMKDAQHFVYSMPVSTVSFGCTSVAQVEEDIALAKNYTLMTKSEQETLIKRVTEIAQNNFLEHYKGTR
jgi:predicted aldo/keto reductase-like oxidoreductase